ncbi:ubiquitin-protein ligase (E3) [Coemansia interrupta]|uniref:HECT-type E3 ubiquitin transferase n=1 Tax=Coemansia interrupta TaxID=1126814 RepID=A0A9W8HQU1_9FUNG|nr:ubiquitin-protein ligase (E3) [Coemansia interrupta]
MFGFQGDYKRQRNINLGGSRRNEAGRSGTRAVLNKAHEERQKREEDRRRHKAAVDIQRCWRGSRDTEAWRQKMRESIDISALRDLRSLEAAYDALAVFTTYFNGQQRDVETFHQILRALFGAPSCYQRIAEAAGPMVPRWTNVVCRLLGLAMDTYVKGTASIDAELVQTSLVCATDAGGSGQSLQSAVLLRLIESKGLYAYLSHYICKCDRNIHADGMAAAVTLAVRPFNLPTTAARELAVSLFARWIMSIPGLPNKLGTGGSTAVTRMPVKWPLLAAQVQKDMCQKHAASRSVSDLGGSVFGRQASPPADTLALELAAINTLGNMVAFFQPQLSQKGAVTELDTAFIQACAACIRLLPTCDPFAHVRASRSPRTAGERLVAAADPQALRWLNKLLSAPLLELLVRASNTSDEGVSAAAQELLLVLTQTWGDSVSRSVLDSISQMVDIRTVGWRGVLSDPAFLHAFAGEWIRPETIEGPGVVRLQLLCRFLNRQLQTMGDDELFAQGMSLPIGDLKTVARVCRNIAFALYWSAETPEHLVPLRDLSAAIARELYVRNSRHRFADERFWLMPATVLDMSLFADRVAEDPIFAVKYEDEAHSDDESSSEGEADDGEMDSDDDGSNGGGGSGRMGWLATVYSGMKRQPRKYMDRVSLTPRIAVLRNIPFVVPFNDRVRLLHALINRDRVRLGLAPLGNAPSLHGLGMGMHTVRAVIRRGSVFNDAFEQLYPVLSGKPVKRSVDDGDAGPANEQASAAQGRSAGRIAAPFAFGSMDDQDDAVASWNMFGGMPLLPTSDAEPEPADPWQRPHPVAQMTQVQRNDAFKGRMQIEFVDQYGMREAGVDGGGVFKEFLTSLVNEAFSPKQGMFSATRGNQVYPSPTMQGDATQVDFEKYRFLGAVIGKALYDGVLVDVPFAPFFLGRCMGAMPTFNDLPALDEELYRGLVALKNYPVAPADKPAAGNDQAAAAAASDEIYRVFGLDFTVTVDSRDGRGGTRTVPLVANGEAIKVTSHNRMLYLDLIAHFKLTRQNDRAVHAFLSGVHTMVPEPWLRLLFATPLEFSRLLCGDSGKININDWRRNTEYEGAYRAKRHEHPTIRAFWDVVMEDLSEKQRRELCRFATSCERPPLLGFAELNPTFCITSSASDENGNHDHRLPSASTCVNLLKLPVFSSRDILRDKLLQAIESGAGFDLS